MAAVHRVCWGVVVLLTAELASSPCREGGRLWRRFLEGGDSGPVLRQRPSSDLLRPPRH